MIEVEVFSLVNFILGEVYYSMSLVVGPLLRIH
jgi:hypothetical protein